MKKILSLCAVLLSGGILCAVSYAPHQLVNTKPLNMKEMKSDPMDQMQQWYQEAKEKMGDLNASVFVLGTVNDDCEPSTRSMIAMSMNGKGFTFFGDEDSAKFEDLEDNSAAAATFLWMDQQRQVSFRGKAVPLARKEKQDAFDKQSKGSKITTHVSEQGEELEDLDKLKQKHQDLSKKLQNQKVPMPEAWTGYRFEPEVVSFWQAGEHGLHSRVVYVKKNGKWTKKMVQP